MLNEINGKECHLLLGNGFNNSLGIETNYKSIFEKMKEEYSGYNEMEEIIKNQNYDIEHLILELTKNLESVNMGDFLKKYVANKVKLDFMKAANSIVTKQIKNIYQEKNQGIYLILKNFKNYFTLNYDAFLYLLLMKFKSNGEKTVAFQNTTLFQVEDLNQQNDSMYNEIKAAYEQGKINITVKDTSVTKNLDTCTKAEFTTNIKNYFSEKKWPGKTIKRAVDLLWREIKNQSLLENINDGFSLFKEDYIYNFSAHQNLFFLHGAFHIYQDRQVIKKITQSQNKALYERLEKIINSEEKEIICILAGKSDDKEQEIKENDYLKSSLEKLSKLNDTLVILGSSLGENDKHIFERINHSSIKSIYISSCEKEKKKDHKKARRIFPQKQIILFDYETISYGET